MLNNVFSLISDLYLELHILILEAVLRLLASSVFLSIIVK